MRRSLAIVTAAAVMAIAAPLAAAGAHSHHPDAQTPGKAAAKKAPAKKPPEVRCVVLGNKVTDLKRAPKSVYKGKTYYFCCPDCKPKFDKNPEKYVKSAKPAAAAVLTCPVMGGKVKDTKTALKSVYKGKTYYFCCPGCKPRFDANPEQYINKAPENTSHAK